METPAVSAGTVYVSKRYRFSASHKLYSHELSSQENRLIFGKCANPHGHGHNYQLIVTVGGEIDPVTGMAFDLGLLDETVDRSVVRRYDHRYLNMDVEDYLNLVPTGENIVRRIWTILSETLPHGKLRKLRLIETRDNYFEYEGEETPR